jgi:hypothetical protein
MHTVYVMFARQYAYSLRDVLHALDQRSVTVSLPRAALAVCILSGAAGKNNNIVDSKRNYFFNVKSMAGIHLKTIAVFLRQLSLL